MIEMEKLGIDKSDSIVDVDDDIQEEIIKIMDAYNKLAADSDVVCIEGAGSPAEINLRENDIVTIGNRRLIFRKRRGKR